ncbi:conserved hypothetical protein [Methanococcus maripaludis C5]|uniref:Epoxyqueuosine reductase n=1 Tax=Methanococcus maripaludis (strain C5 / ATCC BAA-1333) TaxID=402880 RepID=A4FZ13_METM5|nr:epoxyqueuosine reductase [Methanococcus maripaludis]ABO35447.1 conserved hypothetical protein [Methanococcus maripaludis C5]
MQALTPEKLSELLIDMAKRLGSSHVGINNKETLKDSHFTTDLGYVLKGANSAITFAVPFSEENLDEYIDKYLSKKDHKTFEKCKVRATTLANGIALEIASFLDQIGYGSKAVNSNYEYRKENLKMVPPISHKLLALRSGIGHIGYSSLIITKEYGSSVAFATVVTTAELIPTKPLPAEENYCNNCKLCSACCLSNYRLNEEINGDIGGVKYTHAKTDDPARCIHVCGGFSGHGGKKWSTWSPARFEIPKDNNELINVMHNKAIPKHVMRSKIAGFEGGFYHPRMPGFKMEYTCSLCQVICHKDPEVRKERYRKLVNSGVIIEKNGKRMAVSAEEAKKWLDSLPEEKRKLYTE